jgi:hypothetical protein
VKYEKVLKGGKKLIDKCALAIELKAKILELTGGY